MVKLRICILLTLIAVAGGCAGPSLSSALQSPEWEQRMGAADQLKHLKATEKNLELVLIASEDTSPYVRERGAYALRRMLDPRTVSMISERFESASTSAQIALAQALAQSDAETIDAALPFLIKMLESSDGRMCPPVLRAFLRAQTPDKRPPLLRFYDSENEDGARIAALVAAAYPPDDARKDADVISRMTALIESDASILHNPSVLQAAGHLRITEAVPYIIELANHPELKYLAVESLGYLRAREAVPALLGILDKDDSWVMQRQVYNALGEIRDPDAAAVLAERFAYSMPHVHRDEWDSTLFMTIAMARTGGDDVFEAFASQLTEPTRRSFALIGLHTLTQTRVVHPENMWLYSWDQVADKWRAWWQDNKEAVARRIQESDDSDR